jgi:hypothetical protein
MAMLKEKTKGNLTIEEQRMLENSVTELRFRYVQAMDEAAKQPAPEPTAPDSAPEAAPQD